MDRSDSHAMSTWSIGAPPRISSGWSSAWPHHPYLRGAPPGLPFRWDVATLERGLNFTLTTDVGDLDAFGEITGGGGYEDLLPHTSPSWK